MFNNVHGWIKPDAGTPIDWGHPLSRDLRMAWLGCENTGPTIRNYAPYANQLTGFFGANGQLWAPSTTNGLFGPQVWHYNTPDNGNNIQAGGFWGNPASLTLNVWCNSTRGSQTDVISLGDNHLIRTVNVRGIYRYASNWHTIDTGRNIDGTGWHMLTFTIMAGLQIVWIDGDAISGATNSEAPIYDQGFQTYLGINGSGSGFQFQGDIGPAYVWGRVLERDEILQLYLDPFCMLYQGRKRQMTIGTPPPPAVPPIPHATIISQARARAAYR